MIGNPLGKTPAYVVATEAGNAAGLGLGTRTATVTEGQLAQHALHLEPHDRAAGRIAQGAHGSAVDYDRDAAGLPLIVTVLWTLPAGVAALADAMIAAEGRRYEGRWYGTYNHVTSNCTGHGFDAERGPRHDRCNGWISPLTGAKRCMCPCHDTNRMTYDLARAVTADRVAASEYLAAVALPAPAAERLAGKAQAWADARAALLAAGGWVGAHPALVAVGDGLRIDPLPAAVSALTAS